MSRTKREKSGDTICHYEWPSANKAALVKCPHVCRLEYKHDTPHYCCNADDGETE